MQRTEPALLIPALVIGTALTLFCVVGFFQRESQADFTMFYDSGRAWNNGNSPYTATHANLNPPLVVALVFAPLARLPYSAAQAAWFIASALALVASLRLVVRELALTPIQTWCLVAALSVTYPWCLLWFGGQITFLLMLPFTNAWRALRAARYVRAGAWLAPVIAVKPPFALLALLLPAPVWLSAGALSAAGSCFGVLLTGWKSWQEWFQLGQEISWLSWADNASLWGVITRVQSGWLGGGGIGDLSWTARLLLILLAVAAAVRVLREKDADRRLTLAIVWLLLVTPLGWVYYAIIGAGPMRASWVPSVWAWMALCLLAVPVPLIYPLLSTRWTLATLGSVYAAALLCAWVAIEAQGPGRQAPAGRCCRLESK